MDDTRLTILGGFMKPWLYLFIFFLVIISFCESIPVLKAAGSIENTAQIHHQEFVKELKAAKTDPWAKYGIYSARLIAVKNPEVYLQGDMIFAEYITSQPGYEQAYREGPASMYFYKFNQVPPDGRPFSFELVDFEKYEVVPQDRIFSDVDFVYGFLDERLSAIHTTLKVKQVTSLEAAGLIYIKKRLEGSPLDQTYLILTQDKAGFVFSQEHFYDSRGHLISKEAVRNPVLIFNEKAVWYPLMERNDCANNFNLRTLVQSLSTVNHNPVLTRAEQDLIDQLKIVSSLETSSQKELAAIFASHYAGFLGLDNPMSAMMANNIPGIINKRAYLFLNALILKHGNYLSPRAAALANLITADPVLTLKKFETVYLTNVACEKVFSNGNKEYSAWGHTWPCTLNENNIDDSFRTRGGHCISQSANISAICDMAGLPNIHLNYLSPQDSHSIVILPTVNQVFDNGRLLGKESYHRENRLVEVGIVKDQMIVLKIGGLIYVTGPEVDGYALHQTVAEAEHQVINARMLVQLSKARDNVVYRSF